MKISILTPDLSHNCLGRAYILAKVLQRRYEVEIIGPILNNKIWKPVANDQSIVYKPLSHWNALSLKQKIKKISEKTNGDIIYTSKLLFRTFGMGLIKKFISRKILILDIDDWEMGFIKRDRKKSLIPYQVLEKLTYFADGITVSNNFLQKRFGGTIICHGRDTKTFDPNKFDKNLLRKKYKIEKNKKIIAFLGTPRPDKGTDDLLKAVSLIKQQDILLLLVGIDNDTYSQHVIKNGKELLGNKIQVFGIQPFEKIPEFLTMSDIIVIPQRKNFATIGQTPAKIFDAMAMAKPIIATRVGNLPEILDGCGWIVEPENPKELAKRIQYVLNHPEKAKQMGQEAREKCIKQYSWNAMEKILIKIFEKYE